MRNEIDVIHHGSGEDFQPELLATTPDIVW